MVFIPESPRWLLQHDKRDKARKALVWLRPTQEIVESELDDIQTAIDTERSLAQSVSVWDMFANPIDRRRTLLAVGAVTTQAASGAMYMIVAAIYNANPGTESTGRAIVGLSVIFIMGYNGMVSTYAWLSGGELPSQRLRSYTFGLAAAIGFLGAWLTTFTAPYFINPDSLNWGPKYGYIWFPSCLIAAAFVYFCLPEVKDRTLEEIDEMFEMRLPARKFASYKCVGRHARDQRLDENADTASNSEKVTTEVIEKAA
ncbi:hypothetical protein Plec18167_002807 [Paecilomyces lecythidis]|uniref:Major facilitator superfamily (MFS) profile domain-containing protein n=1 Tax=Paecilomyces lecythidis TaxID=3004212 RepID=A0ABR3Y287_9EURO